MRDYRAPLPGCGAWVSPAAPYPGLFPGNLFSLWVATQVQWSQPQGILLSDSLPKDPRAAFLTPEQAEPTSAKDATSHACCTFKLSAERSTSWVFWTKARRPNTTYICQNLPRGMVKMCGVDKMYYIQISTSKTNRKPLKK